MPSVKIDLTNGILEVEGEETFVKEIYNSYKDQLMQAKPESQPISLGTELKNKPLSSPVQKRTKQNGNRRKESFQIVKDLDLSSRANSKSLRDFYLEKQPSNGMQKSTIFVYYLEKVVNLTGIGPDHIYTCYKDVDEKIPGALRQSLLDASFRKGYIDTKQMNNIKITVHGENLVEHDLPPKVAVK